MDDRPYAFLSTLLATPSVSGFEQPAAKVIKDYLKPYATEVRTDVHGNTLFALNPKGSPRVMLAGHVDQIGFLVNHINEQGFIYLTAVGGVDLAVVPGLRLHLHGRNGPVLGVIGRKAIHLMKPEERDGGKKFDLTELHVDIGAKNKEEALKLVDVGDSVTYILGVAKLGDDLITGPGLDDKVGAFVVAEALRLLAERAKKSPGKLKAAVYSVATVQEEIGLRGAHTAAFGIDPQVGIAIDVCHATDYPGADEKMAGTMKAGKGPSLSIGPNINPPLNKILFAAAHKAGIAVQKEAAPRATGTDANVIQVTRSGVAAALVGLPCRYMHTPVEVVSLADLEAAAKLLAEAIWGLTGETSFIP